MSKFRPTKRALAWTSSEIVQHRTQSTHGPTLEETKLPGTARSGSHAGAGAWWVWLGGPLALPRQTNNIYTNQDTSPPNNMHLHRSSMSENTQAPLVRLGQLRPGKQTGPLCGSPMSRVCLKTARRVEPTQCNADMIGHPCPTRV